jgi:hypothetical protein
MRPMKINNVTTPMTEAIKVVYASIFTTQELTALSNLVFKATSDERFYDWEMPTLIGFNSILMIQCEQLSSTLISTFTIKNQLTVLN